MHADTSDFTMMTRHTSAGGKRTTIALESAYWRQIDRKAAAVGLNWQRWLDHSLADKPNFVGKARWLRVIMLP